MSWLTEIAEADGCPPVEAALAFLEVGAIPPGAWASLDTAGRAVFVAAARDLWTRRAVTAATAGLDTGAALALLAPIDGGRAHAHALLTAALNGLAKGRRGGGHVPVQ